MNQYRALILGAGLVVKPLLDDLLAFPDIDVRLATLNIDRALELLHGKPRGSALKINAADELELLPQVREASVVVSLLPADQHVKIARACLDYRVPLVTTSYVSGEMQALHSLAEERGVLLLNEAGLDPGIDHMTAVEVIRRVEREGGKVLSFASYCGAIPSPEANTNPWGYKFAWSPRGVVLAARNPVRYLENGNVVQRDFPDFFQTPRKRFFEGIGWLEAYPNRDCLRYLKPYGLSGVSDFFRGTLRYPGWCKTWHSLFDLGMLSAEPRDWTGMTYADFIRAHLPESEGGLIHRLASRLAVSEDHDVIARLEWLGLLSDRNVVECSASPLDVLTTRLERKLRYAPGEQDLVVQEHCVIATQADGGMRSITKKLVMRGAAGDDSALAKTVGIPAAIACRVILDGEAGLSGVQIPVDPRLTQPILLGLSRRGIHVHESEEPVSFPQEPQTGESHAATGTKQ